MLTVNSKGARMTKLSQSPEKNSFQKNSLLKRVEAGDTTAEHAEEMIEFYKSFDQQRAEQEARDEWKVNNLEYDLRSTDWILEKTRASGAYAQNLYAAMCNNDFQKQDVWEVLSDNTWSCSWRAAGGVVATLRDCDEDYMDYYCSGMGGFGNYDRDPSTYYEETGYVSESTVTDEVREDLLKLGWIVIQG